MIGTRRLYPGRWRGGRHNVRSLPAAFGLSALALVALLTAGPVTTAGSAILTIAAEPNPAAIPPSGPGHGGGEVEVSVTLSGSTTETSFLDLYLEPGTAACAASTLAEEARGNAARPTALNGSTVDGPFSQVAGENFTAPGVHRLCGFLTPDSNPAGNESASPSATATLLVTVESRTATQPPAVGPECVVPRVIGLRLAAVKAVLAAAGCRLGTVRRAPSTLSERGYVIAQAPAAGRHLRTGAAVRVVVGAGGKRTKATRR